VRRCHVAAGSPKPCARSTSPAAAPGPAKCRSESWVERCARRLRIERAAR
jgi:hypothetical protein